MICCKCNRDIPNNSAYCMYCGKKQTPLPRAAKRRGNGTGTVFKIGNYWRCQVTTGYKVVDGKARAIRLTKSGFLRKKDALDYIPTLLAGKAGTANKPMTFAAIYDQWLPIHESKVSRSTIDCYKAARRYFEPIANYQFSDINLDDLQSCLNECDKGKRTKENMKALAGLLYKYAIPRRQSDLNYAEYLYTGSDIKGSHPAFTAMQVDAIRKLIGKAPHAADLYALIYTGFRPTELFSLKKDDYKNGILFGGIKTDAGKNRPVPVSARIKPIIEMQLNNPSIWLFPKDDGEQMTARYFRDTYFYQILAAAGIQDMPTPEKPAYYVPYSARHTFANLIKNAVGSDKDKAGLMGHTEYRTTEKHYQTAEIDALKSIINQI